MSRLDDIFDGSAKRALAFQTNSAHVLAATGGATATVQTTNPIVGRFGGVTRSRAALSAQSIAPTHNIFGNVSTAAYAQPASTTAYLVLGVNAAGTVCVVQGTFDGQILAPAPTAGLGAFTNAGAQLVGDGRIPSLPDGFAPFGLIKVVTGASVTFTPGVTNLNAAGLTLTFWDIGLIPEGRP